MESWCLWLFNLLIKTMRRSGSQSGSFPLFYWIVHIWKQKHAGWWKLHFFLGSVEVCAASTPSRFLGGADSGHELPSLVWTCWCRGSCLRSRLRLSVHLNHSLGTTPEVFNDTLRLDWKRSLTPPQLWEAVGGRSVQFWWKLMFWNSNQNICVCLINS